MDDSFDYFSMMQKYVKKSAYDDIKPEDNENASDKPDKLAEQAKEPEQQETVQHEETVPEETSPPEPDTVVANSYQSDDNDAAIAAFASQIGKNMIPGAIIVPPPDDAPDDTMQSDQLEEQTPDPVVNNGPADDQKPRRPYVAPKSDYKVKVDYADEEKHGIKFSNLKKVPTDIVTLAERYFPNASNKMDAVAAYIYVREGCPSDVKVPDGIKELSESFQGESITPADLEKSVAGSLKDFRNYVQKQLHDLAGRLYTVELLLGYSVFDQLEFRHKNVPSPSDIDFYESGLADLIKHAEKEADKQRKKAEYERNRPL